MVGDVSCLGAGTVCTIRLWMRRFQEELSFEVGCPWNLLQASTTWYTGESLMLAAWQPLQESYTCPSGLAKSL